MSGLARYLFCGTRSQSKGRVYAEKVCVVAILSEKICPYIGDFVAFGLLLAGLTLMGVARK
jgi:hypothetical protein